MDNNKDGFTILELIITLSIIAIFTGIVAPNVNEWLAGYRLSSSARDIYSTLQLSRLRAVKENANVVVVFDKDNDIYLAFVDNGAGGGDEGNDAQDGDEPIIKNVNLQEEMNGVIDMVSVTEPLIRFNNRGFVSPLGTTVQIRNNNNSNNRWIVLSTTGHVRISNTAP